MKNPGSTAPDHALRAPPARSAGRWLALGIALWLAAVVLAARIDAPLASRVYSSGVYQAVKYSLLFRLLKAPGNVWALPFLILFVWWLSRPAAAPALLLGLTAALAGLFTIVLKWSVGRVRPIANGVYNQAPFQPHFFHDGLGGLFGAQHNISFPSGHACLAFAIAGTLSCLLPRHAIWFFVLATLVGAERLLEGAHYLSDVLAGGGLGILAAILATRLGARLARYRATAA